MKCNRIAQLLVPLLFSFTLLHAQTVTVSVESGYSINHAPVAGFTAGVNFKYFSIRTGMDAHLSSQVNDGIVFKTMIAHTFNFGEQFYGTAGIGHAYLYKSADNKSVNSNQLLVNPEIGYKCSFKEQPFALYVGYTQAGGDIKMLLGGIRAYF